MTAKEMFEELGLERIEKEPSNMIWYSSKLSMNGMYRVRFHLFYKYYDVTEYGSVGDRIIPELHNAIHQQLKELNWIEE